MGTIDGVILEPVYYRLFIAINIFAQVAVYWWLERGHWLVWCWIMRSCCCSVSMSCPTLCDPMGCSKPDSSVHSPGVCSSSCPLSQWCYLDVSSSADPFSFCLQSFPGPGSFPEESALHIRWPKYRNFSFSDRPSNEYSGFISFRVDWFELFAVQYQIIGINNSMASF